eukprot:COSAG03_NODE_67_length_15062_cov_86.408781_9_plen_59_part_00
MDTCVCVCYANEALIAWSGVEAEEVCIYTGTAQRFPTLVLALIPYSLSAAFALLKHNH